MVFSTNQPLRVENSVRRIYGNLNRKHQLTLVQLGVETLNIILMKHRG